jgi:hypothetical protein
MTDCAIATAPHPVEATTTTPSGRSARRRARALGVPAWTRLFGAALVPLDGGHAHPTAFVLSAGAGTTYVATIVHDREPDDSWARRPSDRDVSREDHRS